MSDRKSKINLEKFKLERNWPEGMPMPAPGAFNVKGRWTYDEEQLLRKFYPLYGPRYCARLLGRTRDGVKIRASRLHLDKLWTPWSDKDLAYIRRWFGKRSVRELSEKLGRTEVSIRQRSIQLGLVPPRAWSDRHTALLRRYYGRKKLDDLSVMLGRQPHTITSMASKLGLCTPRFKPTDEQIAYVMANVGKISFTGIAAHLAISPDNVRRIARRRGFDAEGRHVNQWSDDEKTFLAENYSTMSLKEISTHIGRSAGSISQQSRKLGISPDEGWYHSKRAWSAGEDALLRKLHGTMSRPRIAEKMGRSRSSVGARIRQLELPEQAAAAEPKWSRREDAILREIYPNNGIQHVAARLGRSRTGVRLRAEKLGLQAPDNGYGTPWTASEDARLRRLYPGHGNPEIARRLGRSADSVCRRANRLGLRKAAAITGSVWTSEELEVLRKMYGNATAIEMARLLGRSVESTRKRLRALGLQKRHRISS